MKNNSSLEEKVALLSGYILGASEFSGNLRDYSAYSYVIPVASDLNELMLNLKQYYEEQTELSFSFSEKLTNGYKSLEQDLCQYLSGNMLFGTKSYIENLGKYLSFRVTDYIDDIVGYWTEEFDRNTEIEVYKLKNISNGENSICVFFCILLKDTTLVLQFNDNKPFLKYMEKINTPAQIEEYRLNLFGKKQ